MEQEENLGQEETQVKRFVVEYRTQCTRVVKVGILARSERDAIREVEDRVEDGTLEADVLHRPLLDVSYHPGTSVIRTKVVELSEGEVWPYSEHAAAMEACRELVRGFNSTELGALSRAYQHAMRALEMEKKQR